VRNTLQQRLAAFAVPKTEVPRQGTSNLKGADLVVLGIADIERVGMGKQAVRTIEAASQRIAVRPVAFLASSGNRGNCSVRQGDFADHVIFGVGNIEIAA